MSKSSKVCSGEMSVNLNRYWFNLKIALRACPDNVLWVSVKEPQVEKNAKTDKLIYNFYCIPFKSKR